MVDGILAKLTAMVVAAAGTILRAFQTGVVHAYAAVFVIGLASATWFFGVPHANATVDDDKSGGYTVTATPGVGYAYRWDADGDGKPDKPDFAGDPTIKVHLDQGKTRDLWNLEVKNAFRYKSSSAPRNHPRRAAAREPTSSPLMRHCSDVPHRLKPPPASKPDQPLVFATTFPVGGGRGGGADRRRRRRSSSVAFPHGGAVVLAGAVARRTGAEESNVGRPARPSGSPRRC